LANRETAAAQIALLELQRLQTNMQLYQDRLQNLEIRSPTGGVVISGDLKKLTGARLTIGQTLLEVGPLGEMVLELSIPDEDILHAQPDATVRFRLDALPQSTLQGRLVRIQPRSELRDNQNVFVGEVQIAQDASVLRPGMRGRAKLAAGHRSLFWILFHRAIERLLFQLGW
jgi:multidrug resistance efflux pump